MDIERNVNHDIVQAHTSGTQQTTVQLHINHLCDDAMLSSITEMPFSSIPSLFVVSLDIYPVWVYPVVVVVVVVVVVLVVVVVVVLVVVVVVVVVSYKCF